MKEGKEKRKMIICLLGKNEGKKRMDLRNILEVGLIEFVMGFN